MVEVVGLVVVEEDVIELVTVFVGIVVVVEIEIELAYIVGE